jgi:hypothetical protein
MVCHPPWGGRIERALLPRTRCAHVLGAWQVAQGGRAMLQDCGKAAVTQTAIPWSGGRYVQWPGQIPNLVHSRQSYGVAIASICAWPEDVM